MARTADPNRRADILQAARETFQERGYTRARIADVAARAGVAPGTIYLYFASKEAMVLALAEQFFANMADATLPKIDQPDSMAAINDAVHAGLTYAAQERDLLKFTFLDAGFNATKPAPAQLAFRDELAHHLSRRMDEGTWRRYDPAILSDLIIGMMVRAVEAGVLQNHDLKRYEQTITALLCHTLLPHA
ncbi:MAG TPA: helix-turn-helix domain-containing protein [Roseiflexaceae bacterium]|jgi:AcrR family transcriptional regulator|nr:helix-turn-helix domain-containing protein [Roseiflexaceae bacterium]